MKSIDIKGAERTIQTPSSAQAKALKQLRRNNEVPCVLYGGEKNINFSVKADALRNLIYTPHIYLVNLDIDGKAVKAVLKDAQFHPVKDHILHVDFYEVTEDKPIVMAVPVKLQGLAQGVRAGGKMNLQMRRIKVRAPYTQIPEHLDVDVTELGLGKSIKVGELHFEGLEIASAKEAVVCAVKLTRAARGAAAAAAEASK